MWTPKRVLILVGGFALFLVGYAIYSYFLGGIDGLPPLPPEMLPVDGYLAGPPLYLWSVLWARRRGLGKVLTEREGER